MARERSNPRQTGVLLDLNNPEFLDVFLRLESAELHQVAAALYRMQRLNWNTVYKAPGFKWEAVKHIRGPNGQTIYSIRLSVKTRALAYRDGSFMRFLSLHPDHDSAYRK
jgi:hypothetical protein